MSGQGLWWRGDSHPQVKRVVEYAVEPCVSPNPWIFAYGTFSEEKHVLHIMRPFLQVPV